MCNTKAPSCTYCGRSSAFHRYHYEGKHWCEAYCLAIWEENNDVTIPIDQLESTGF